MGRQMSFLRHLCIFAGILSYFCNSFVQLGMITLHCQGTFPTLTLGPFPSVLWYRDLKPLGFFYSLLNSYYPPPPPPNKTQQWTRDKYWPVFILIWSNYFEFLSKYSCNVESSPSAVQELYSCKVHLLYSFSFLCICGKKLLIEWLFSLKIVQLGRPTFLVNYLIFTYLCLLELNYLAV